MGQIHVCHTCLKIRVGLFPYLPRGSGAASDRICCKTRKCSVLIAFSLQRTHYYRQMIMTLASLHYCVCSVTSPELNRRSVIIGVPCGYQPPPSGLATPKKSTWMDVLSSYTVELDHPLHSFRLNSAWHRALRNCSKWRQAVDTARASSDDDDDDFDARCAQDFSLGGGQHRGPKIEAEGRERCGVGFLWVGRARGSKPLPTS